MTILRKGSRGEEVKRLQRALGLIDDGVFSVLTDEALREFQRKNGLFPDGVCGPKTWALIDKDNGYVMKRSRRRIDLILVHCTATPEGQDRTVEQIRDVHKANGWSDIGYHYLVYRDGSIHNGRDVDKIGAHCAGYNTYSIGVCYVGGVENRPGVPYDQLKPKDTRTPEQKVALVKLLHELRDLYPNAKIAGHRNYDTKGKLCPSFDARTEYRDI